MSFLEGVVPANFRPGHGNRHSCETEWSRCIASTGRNEKPLEYRRQANISLIYTITEHVYGYQVGVLESRHTQAVLCCTKEGAETRQKDLCLIRELIRREGLFRAFSGGLGSWPATDLLVALLGSKCFLGGPPFHFPLWLVCTVSQVKVFTCQL